jgi:hypothetical protein
MQINPAMKVNIVTIGNEKTPVVVIDDVLLETSSIMQHACHSVEFEADKLTAYPGVRAQLPKWFTDTVMDFICPVFRQQYDVSEELLPAPIMAYLSLLTTAPNELQLLQRMPHFDSVKDSYFSLVLYLNQGDFGGTGFFRHRPTGFERILDHRYDNFVLAGKAFTNIYGAPQMKYINASDEHFELIDSVAYKPNRLVAYPGNLLHSGMVDPDVDISGDPLTGRLTANLFIDFSQGVSQ